MALVPRIKVAADTEHPSVAAVLVDLDLFAERFNAGPGFDMRTTDAHAAERLHDNTIGRLRRADLTVPVIVKRHNCPHVAGLEEPTWTRCTDAQYGYSETVI